MLGAFAHAAFIRVALFLRVAPVDSIAPTLHI
jgi:hypothetical protein